MARDFNRHGRRGVASQTSPGNILQQHVRDKGQVARGEGTMKCKEIEAINTEN